ncbi:LysR substrate-binding domain-containing protein [Saccharopolyspora phatthalungensis]|uniref:DNA-binding transcriptional LysR family regulator n=1 Tax=Saccharopolyspora phatthalungensis TaxID=664693 RepID=A0A840QHL5_9PSEU|nr:LysR substrate-binding domain-containing protein [Saccharopolyspora phatthalungensis]MBB5156763.1 DNA-binding transcriptional LysR family regulator [Saccharopolyspora phatthalungensis]
MELRHLRAFVAVAEELNFRRAAVRLHMSQPPLSQQIKRLEHEVGVALLRRTTRHVALTAAGEAFLREARKALLAAEAAPRLARQAAAGEIGVVRLGFSGQTSYRVMLLIVRKFRERYPNVRFDIVSPLYGGELVDQINQQEIDAGLLRLPVPTEGLCVRELEQHPLAVALPEDHRLAGARRVGLADLRNESFISYPANRGSVVNQLVQAACMQHDYSPNFVQEAPDTHTILSLVGAGSGISLVPMTAGHLKVPGVVLVSVHDAPSIPLALVWRRDDQNPALAGLVGLLDEVAAQL